MLFWFPHCLSLLFNSSPPTLFQSNCAQYAADRREEEKMCDHLISAAKHRDHVTANQLKQKILNILTNKHGAWGTMSQRWEGLCVKLYSGTFLDHHYTGSPLTGDITLVECSHGTLPACNEKMVSVCIVVIKSAPPIMYGSISLWHITTVNDCFYLWKCSSCTVHQLKRFIIIIIYYYGPCKAGFMIQSYLTLFII